MAFFNRIRLLWIPPFLIASYAATASAGILLDKLRTDLDDGRLEAFSKIETAFILSGADTPDSLKTFMNWYGSLLETIRAYRWNPMDRTGSANKLFAYLHATRLKTYQLEATTLADVIKAKRFNCVSGTILFNLLCEDLGWETDAFETPTHVYTVFHDFGKTVLVENTSPMGFDVMKNLKAYSESLAQYYPDNRSLQIGLERLWAYENSRGRPINNIELLGLLAYNRAYFAQKASDDAGAYDWVLLAQSLNRDSRSNVDLEIHITYSWGAKLAHESRFAGAFEVFADGIYRHPGEKGLAKNTRAAFWNAIDGFWKTKDWASTQKLTLEIRDLSLLTPEDKENLERLWRNWEAYFMVSIQKDSIKELKALRASLTE